MLKFVCTQQTWICVCVCVLTRTEAQLAHQPGVAGAEPVAELGDERLQVLAPLLRRVDVPEEVPQGVGQELVTEVVEGHQLVQDVPPARTKEISLDG